LTLFKKEEKEIAAGRTSSCTEIVEAIWHWLDGESLSSMYERFEFVDKQKREFVSIRDSALQQCPGLNATAPGELKYRGSGLYSLWFRTPSRSAHIFYYFDKKFPDARFHWDQSELFCFKAEDNSQLAAVLKSWLCENAMPSAMRKEFPWLNIGDLADYYENGNPVEGEFIKSWNWLAQWVKEMPSNHASWEPWTAFILPLLRTCQDAGLNRYFRVGQSMSHIIFSTAERHGLEQYNPPPPRITLLHESSRDEWFIAWSLLNLMVRPEAAERKTKVNAEDAFPVLKSYLTDLWRETRSSEAIPAPLLTK
jgi:hypothetical protein